MHRRRAATEWTAHSCQPVAVAAYWRLFRNNNVSSAISDQASFDASLSEWPGSSALFTPGGIVSESMPSGAAELLAGFVPGTRVAGYLLLDQVGAGGMAVVFGLETSGSTGWWP